MIYKAKEHSFLTDTEAQVIGPIIADLCDMGRGTPDNIVAKATPEDSPLHPHFTWDDTKAARNWRKQEARILVNAITVEFEDRVIPAFESVPVVVTEEGGEEAPTVRRVYLCTSTILGSADDYAKIRAEIVSSLRAIQRKLQNYDGLVGEVQMKLIDETIRVFEE
jgi:hypothetical protein